MEPLQASKNFRISFCVHGRMRVYVNIRSNMSTMAKFSFANCQILWQSLDLKVGTSIQSVSYEIFVCYEQKGTQCFSVKERH